MRLPVHSLAFLTVLLGWGCGVELGGRSDAGRDARVGVDAGTDASGPSVDGGAATIDGGAATIDVGLPGADGGPVGTDAGADVGPFDFEMCPPPGGQDCSPVSADCSWGFDPPSCFYDQVAAAIRATMSSHPEWFSHDDEYMCDAIAAGFDDDYMAEVVQRLEDGGLCAHIDTGDEIGVKLNGTYSEQFDIVVDPAMRTSPPPRCVRSGAGSYMGRNVPSCF